MELIQSLNDWFEHNRAEIDEKCSDLFLKIQRLNTKSSDRNNAFQILEQIIDVLEPNFISIREPFYMISLKKGCELLILKTITPYELNQILIQIDCEFDIPGWTGELYNVLDWIEKNSPIEYYMIEEAKERIEEINEILKTQYNKMYSA